MAQGDLEENVNALTLRCFYITESLSLAPSPKYVNQQ